MFLLRLCNSSLNLRINSAGPFRRKVWGRARECPRHSPIWARARSRTRGWPRHLRLPDRIEIVQNYVGVSSWLSFEMDFVSFTLPSLNYIVACYFEVSCAAHSHFLSNLERTVFLEPNVFSDHLESIWGNLVSNNRDIGRPFLLQGDRRLQQPVHQTLVTMATNRVMNVNFALF